MMVYTTNDAQMEAFFEQWVPTSGKCETLAGELVRAAARIKYDYLNNGFGNNWTGALNFLDQKLDLPRKAYAKLTKYANCRCAPDTKTMYQKNEDPILLAIEKVENTVIAFVAENRKAAYGPTPCDMFDLQEEPTR
jgi:hypothetical protein